MTRLRFGARAGFVAVAIALAVCVAVPARAGQSTAQSSAQTQGPLVLQPIHNDFVVTPDFKFTQIAHTTGELLGGYAGVDFDRKFLVGAGGYWLVDPTNVISMGYGGVLLGWRVTNGHGPIRLDVRDLIGGGSATSYTLYGNGYVPPPPVQVDPRHPVAYYPYYPYYGYPWVGFFVTEPEARVQIALGHSVAIDAGVSYRVVAAASGFEDLLRGAAGSIGVRFSLGQ